ncbi:hypothetical protein MTR67_015979 [Solanum verrucosum]|uniref:Uncharacterized protein n=1 Tax=Solanum verrucosum TaxID=315347 RepID=A0AAF0QMH9_SOLVR|nr:hypothetical protein MTR67_015979 [Solanum verrucosum]
MGRGSEALRSKWASLWYDMLRERWDTCQFLVVFRCHMFDVLNCSHKLHDDEKSSVMVIGPALTSNLQPQYPDSPATTFPEKKKKQPYGMEQSEMFP